MHEYLFIAIEKVETYLWGLEAKTKNIGEEDRWSMRAHSVDLSFFFLSCITIRYTSITHSWTQLGRIFLFFFFSLSLAAVVE